ncbi:MAG: antibiotic biosynthesis monooxygenase [bacterium]|nr:antibiotic biosynthesis monooxygenase [bacterium]
MVLEIAILQIKESKIDNFETDFRMASKYIASIPGYIKHSLHKCIEDDLKYVLQVQWQNLEDHTLGFRQSNVYQEWKELLHHYYEPFPIVEHFQEIEL